MRMNIKSLRKNFRNNMSLFNGDISDLRVIAGFLPWLKEAAGLVSKRTGTLFGKAFFHRAAVPYIISSMILSN